MVAHRRQRQENLCGLEASVVYRIAGTTQRNPVRNRDGGDGGRT